MNANRSAALARILASEGGLRVSDGEPGGASFRGVSLLVFAAWRHSHGLPEPTVDDLAAMPLEETDAIYEMLYFGPVRFDELQSGVDYAVVDYAIEYGKHGALDTIRGLFGIPTPPAFWRMEDALLAALNRRDSQETIGAICDARWAQMLKRPDFPQIGKGLAFRVSSVFRGAMEMTGAAPMPDKYTVTA